MKKLIIFEPLCRGYEHLSFNAALLTSIVHAFPETELQFWGESRHVDLLKEKIAKEVNEKIDWRIMNVPDPSGSYLKKIAGQFNICRKVLREAQRQSSPVFAFSASELTLGISSILMTFLFRRTRLFALLHSLIKYLSNNSSAGLRAKIAGKIIVPLALRMASQKRIRLLVLSSFILERLTQIMPALRTNTRFIDMPYQLKKPSPQMKISERIIIGFAGVGTREKGIDVFFRLARELKDSRSAAGKKAVFSFIGRLGHDCKDMAIPDNILTLSGTGLISQDLFEQAIHECACLIFPYDKNLYELVASASLMDAVRHQKPVLSYRIPFFEGYLNLLGKDAGRICDNYEELKQATLEFIQNYEQRPPIDSDEYFGKAKMIFSPEAVAPQLKKIVEEL